MGYSSMMRHNLELKVRYPDLERAARIVESLGAEYGGTLQQLDTYFHSREGRLKLRENAKSEDDAQLIWYEREDDPDICGSTYLLTGVADPTALRESLRRSVGILTEVRKARDLYVWENVRIHLDDVEGLGRFIEFEAILDDITGQAGRHKLQSLCHHLQIEPTSYIGESYATLVKQKR